MFIKIWHQIIFGIVMILIGGVLTFFIFPHNIPFPTIIDHYHTNTQIKYVYEQLPGKDVYPQNPAEISNQYNKLTNYQGSHIQMDVQEGAFSYKVNATHIDVKDTISFPRKDYSLTFGIAFPPLAVIQARVYNGFGAFGYAGYNFKDGYYGLGLTYSFSLSDIFNFK